MKNLKIICIVLLCSFQFLFSQTSNDLIGSWSGWYEEGQRNYDIKLEIERFNGLVLEGKIKLIYNEKAAEFTIEAELQGDKLIVNERDIVTQDSPKYVENPEWCRADYEFKFSNLQDHFQLKGIAVVPKVNIAYVRGVKVYDSPNCEYFNDGQITLQKRNLNYKVKKIEKKQLKQDLLIRYNSEGKRIATPNSKPREGYTTKEILQKKDEVVVSSSDSIKKVDLDKNNGREVVETKVIKSNEGIALVSVWDNRSVDGDIISIYHNGNLIKENISLLKEKEEVLINLEKGKNVIVMYAVNLGKVPPNSAAMEINTGTKEYSMVLTSDTKKSESIVIYYYP